MVDGVVDVHDVVDGFERLASGAVRGKVVVDLRPFASV